MLSPADICSGATLPLCLSGPMVLGGALIMPLETRTARLPGPDNRSKAPLNNGHEVCDLRSPGWLSLPARGSNLLRAPNADGRREPVLLRPAAATPGPPWAAASKSPLVGMPYNTIAHSTKDKTTPGDDLDALFITTTSEIVWLVSQKSEEFRAPVKKWDYLATPRIPGDLAF